MGVVTLGSLFDGIGGFPLSGVMHGIKPAWAAEIEPFPVLVTSQRFPEMKHLSSVTDITATHIGFAVAAAIPLRQRKRR